jgi:molecular chaperone HscA
MGGLAEKIVPRNSTIPVTRAQEFTTFKDGQTAIAIPRGPGGAREGRRLSLARALRAPRNSADDRGAARVKVTFQVDADGLLSVSAREQDVGDRGVGGREAVVRLSDAEISRMLHESVAASPRRTCPRGCSPRLRSRPISSSRQRARRSSRRRPPGAVGAARDRGRHCSRTRPARGLDSEALSAAIAALNRATGEFAALRMDRGVARGLTGRSIDALT